MARTSSLSEKVYRSKLDVWVLVIIGACLGALAIGMIAALAKGDAMHLAQRFFVTLGVAGLLVWILLGTHYTLTGSNLVVRAGPLSWTIAIDTITSVAPEGGISSMRSSPALSLDRIAIRYGNGRRLLVSPADKAAFIKDIAARGGKV